MRTITNVRKSALNHLIKGTHYNVVDTHQLETVKITRPIPYETGYYKNAFPAYLQEFYAYYDYDSHPWNRGWRLKKEYRKNRPTYTIEVTPVAYDIVLTSWGEEYAQKRFNQYQRLTKQYGSLLK